MPKKKPQPRHSIHIRLNPSEGAALEADLKAMPGVPVSAGVYAKHAVLSYPKLRKLDDGIRRHGEEHGGNPEWISALLKEAGL